jgi:four helix bundle protein
MRRAARSVPFNIGEGVGKRGRARAAAYEIALGETKELMVALDCVELDELAPVAEVKATQDLADRIAAMLTRLIRSAVEAEPSRASEPPAPWGVNRGLWGRDRDRDRDRDRRQQAQDPVTL